MGHRPAGPTTKRQFSASTTANETQNDKHAVNCLHATTMHPMRARASAARHSSSSAGSWPHKMQQGRARALYARALRLEAAQLGARLRSLVSVACDIFSVACGLVSKARNLSSL